LNKEIKFSLWVKTILLPVENEAAITDGTDVLISGWGATQNINEPMEMLRGTILKTINKDECNATFFGGITNRHICASYELGVDANVKSSCFGKYTLNKKVVSRTNSLYHTGDVGGPVERIADGKLIGIVSGLSCKNVSGPIDPDVFINVASIRSWIRSIVKS
jgi:hypothetical protein